MTARFADRVVIVTGGAGGFGAGIARRFAQDGAKVIIADVNEKLGREMASSMPDSFTYLKMDVTSRADWDSVLKEVVSQHGRIDCLVNNAGTTYKNKPTLDVTEAEFQRVFDINVKGIFHGCQAVIPHMIEQGRGGSIINIASIGALRPRPGLVWYNASKGAVHNVSNR